MPILGGAGGGGAARGAAVCGHWVAHSKGLPVRVGCPWVILLLLRHPSCLARGPGHMTRISSIDSPYCVHSPHKQGRPTEGGGSNSAEVAE